MSFARGFFSFEEPCREPVQSMREANPKDVTELTMQPGATKEQCLDLVPESCALFFVISSRTVQQTASFLGREGAGCSRRIALPVPGSACKPCKVLERSPPGTFSVGISLIQVSDQVCQKFGWGVAHSSARHSGETPRSRMCSGPGVAASRRRSL